MHLSIGIFGFLMAFQAKCWANGGPGLSVDANRLPDDTRPESYALAVDPSDVHSPNGSFEGRVEISIRVVNTAAAITLNARDLDLREIQLVDEATDRSVGLRYWEYAASPREQVTIHVDGHVFAGRKYVVRIRFVGRLRDDATGFFRTHYDSSGKKWLLATQFKMKQARSAFPCYDEPRYRTPFNMSIKINNDEIALSNMPIINTVVTNVIGSQNSTWVHFMQTPAIPTFLVSYFVGEFESLNKDHPSLINVYTHLGNLYQIEYINRDMSSLLNVMENYTGVKYALPKLDLLALPELSLDLVEQWGLNTYREQSLFVDKNTKTETKMLVKMLVEKVMAHQWFTGLVNPSRWDYAWINEGFATYFEYFATATLEPDWRLEHFFIVKELQRALEHDQNSNYSTNVVTRKMDEQNYGIVDEISSKKGSAILRMLNDWVGEKVFKRALNIFLTKNQYTAVEPEILWNAFDNALLELTKSNLHGKSVHNIMNKWTEQVGYPMVNVAKEDKLLILTQNRFSVRSLNVNDTTKWFIRLTYTNNKVMDFDSKSAPFIWMDPDTSETIIPIENDVKWYIFNVQSLGYYRVNYTEENWASLTKQLETSPAAIDVTNRAQLIDDSFNLARAGQLNYTVPLKLTRYLDKEDDIIPWFSVMDNLNFVLNQMRRSQDGYSDVKAFVQKIAGVAFQKVNKFIKTSQNIQYPNNIGWNAFSKWACELDDNNCVTMALNYFRRWKNGEDIPADFQDAAFCTGIRHSVDDEDWPKMIKLYRNTKTYSEKESALNALTCTENVKLLITNLVLILTKECSIEPSDYNAFFIALSLRPSGISAMTFFLKYHFMDILQNVTDGEYMVSTIYSTLASKVSTDYETSEMLDIAYVSPSPFNLQNPSSPFVDHYDEIETNKKWFDVHSTTIREFINPGSTVVTETTPSVTTQKTSKHDSSASSRLDSCVILLQILALSVSVKLLVRIG